MPVLISVILGITFGLSINYAYNLPFSDNHIELKKKILDSTGIYNAYLIYIFFMILLVIIPIFY